VSVKKKTSIQKSVELDPRFAPVVDAFAKDRHVTAGKMMSSHGLKVNGKIFAMFGRGQFVVKLPRSRVDDLVGRGKGERFDPGHGRLMKEWIAFTVEKEKWIDLAKEAYNFVKGIQSTTKEK
jgi:TfoX/Sxy family transcriptional regulator of competence genes